MSSQDNNQEGVRKRGGQPGNKNASYENRIFSNAIRRMAVQNPNRVRNMIDAMMRKAEDGDVPAFKELADRVDGKPQVSIELDATVVSHEDALDQLK